jgi:hypothetical protein
MGATLAVVLTVCGGAGATQSSLAGRLLTKGELPGFIRTSKNTFRTHQRGLVAGLNENWTSNSGIGGTNGVSAVWRFKTASSINAASEGTLIAAAQHLYHRVRP